MKKNHILLIITLTLSGNVLGQDESAYVTNDLAISLRQTADPGSPVIRGLKSGTKFTVIERDSTSGLAHIRIDDGTEGWIQSRHITNKPGLQQQLIEAQATIEKLRGEQKQPAATSGQEPSQPISAQEENLKALENENNLLKARVIQLETELQSREQQKGELEDRSARNWFFTGTGVMLLGIIIGIVTPRLRWRRRSSWSEL